MQAYSKAIAAAIAGALVVWLTKHNVIISDELANSVEIVIGAVVTGLTVLAAPRNTNTVR